MSEERIISKLDKLDKSLDKINDTLKKMLSEQKERVVYKISRNKKGEITEIRKTST